MGEQKQNRFGKGRVPPWPETCQAQVWDLEEQGSCSCDQRKGFGNVQDERWRLSHAAKWQPSDVGGRAVLGDEWTQGRDSKYMGPSETKENKIEPIRIENPYPRLSLEYIKHSKYFKLQKTK